MENIKSRADGIRRTQNVLRIFFIIRLLFIGLWRQRKNRRFVGSGMYECHSIPQDGGNDQEEVEGNRQNRLNWE